MLIIFDPIFRGSRLYYSALAAKAAEDGVAVHVVTRSSFDTPHYRDLLHGVEHTIHNVMDIPSDFWYGKVAEDIISIGLNRVVSLCSQAERSPQIYFPGLNEIWPEIGHLLYARRDQFADASIAYVDYHPDFLQKSHRRIYVKSIKGMMVQWVRFQRQRKEKLKRLGELISVGRVSSYVILDERPFYDETKYEIPPWLKKNLIVLCDPAPRHKYLGNEEIAANGSFRLAVIGGQTRRKGFIDVVKLIEHPDFDALQIQILFIGRLSDETEFLRDRIRRAAERVDWVEPYVSDAEMARLLSTADAVLLPYTREFNASSGVLATAVHNGLPVIATSHGLVGFRVRNNVLGCVYESGNIDQLIQAIRDMNHKVNEVARRFYKECKQGVNTYSEAITEDSHRDSLKSIFFHTEV